MNPASCIMPRCVCSGGSTVFVEPAGVRLGVPPLEDVTTLSYFIRRGSPGQRYSAQLRPITRDWPLQMQRTPSRKSSRAAERLFNSQELVVFGDAVGAGGRAGLDLPDAHGDDEIRQERVFRFAAA